MPRHFLSTAALLALAAGVGACSTSRFDGPRARAVPGPQASLDPVVPAVPSGAVTAAPLAPPPGASAAPEPPPVGADIAAAAPPPVVAEPVYTPPPPPPVASGRSGVVGAWNAKDATGASCKVSLSSAPALDLYKASAAGCANKDLAKVTAWDYREGEVYLYQPGGTVAARLRQGGGALDGALTKSGASLALVR